MSATRIWLCELVETPDAYRDVNPLHATGVPVDDRQLDTVAVRRNWAVVFAGEAGRIFTVRMSKSIGVLPFVGKH